MKIEHDNLEEKNTWKSLSMIENFDKISINQSLNNWITKVFLFEWERIFLKHVHFTKIKMILYSFVKYRFDKQIFLSLLLINSQQI
jgi:hypothetical protein